MVRVSKGLSYRDLTVGHSAGFNLHNYFLDGTSVMPKPICQYINVQNLILDFSVLFTGKSAII